MADRNSINKVNNPHDSLFRETLTNRENAVSILQHYLPAPVLDVIDLERIEISKDSFIEKEMSDYYSDILYKVLLKGQPGFVYVLFEHKSYHDRYVHLQLLEYMLKIWRLFINQQKKEKHPGLPIIIPLLICHGKRPWPEDSTHLSSLLNGPVKELSTYIPDFELDLIDLTQFDDDNIKGTLMARVVLLLFKHIFDPNLRKKLPEILSLMETLMAKQTGLQYLETIFRYLASTLDDFTAEEIKNIFQQALSEKQGAYIMTLAEKLREEGKAEGRIEGKAEGRIEGKAEGRLEGLYDTIELGITLTFPDHLDEVMDHVKRIHDLNVLIKIKDTIKIAKDISQILSLIKP